MTTKTDDGKEKDNDDGWTVSHWAWTDGSDDDGSDCDADDFMTNTNRTAQLVPPPQSVNPKVKKWERKRAEHGHKKCPFTCQGCTDERQRCKLNQKKKTRHGRVDVETSAIVIKGNPRELDMAKPEGRPFVEHPSPPESKYCGQGDDADDDKYGSDDDVLVKPSSESLFTRLSNSKEAVAPTAAPAVASAVDLVAYTAEPWFEIAAIPQWFEKDCVRVRAEYDLLKTGDVKVRNYCVKENGVETMAVGHASVPDAAVPAKLKVSFFWPFYADYWILFVDEAYRYAVVGDASRESLWILSRYESIDAETFRRLLVVAEAKGYDVARLRLLPNTVH